MEEVGVDSVVCNKCVMLGTVDAVVAEVGGTEETTTTGLLEEGAIETAVENVLEVEVELIVEEVIADIVKEAPGGEEWLEMTEVFGGAATSLPALGLFPQT